MRSVNKVILIGHLTRDPELRQTANGHPVATFSIATNRYWTTSEGQKQESTEFHDLVAWGRLAEICHENLTKGCAIYVEGRLHTRNWDSPEGGKRYKTEVVVSELNILMRKNGTSAEGPTGGVEFDKELDSSTEDFGSEMDLDLDSGGLPGEEDKK
ncbi:MAG: single-stranded DNA-binding protein [Candidatus Gracilibacteria bacterium]|nr:single-stranded DNA-binding protein [Candidatus Gracilibacteria bacterium]